MLKQEIFGVVRYELSNEKEFVIKLKSREDIRVFRNIVLSVARKLKYVEDTVPAIIPDTVEIHLRKTYKTPNNVLVLHPDCMSTINIVDVDYTVDNQKTRNLHAYVTIANLCEIDYKDVKEFEELWLPTALKDLDIKELEEGYRDTEHTCESTETVEESNHHMLSLNKIKEDVDKVINKIKLIDTDNEYTQIPGVKKAITVANASDIDNLIQSLEVVKKDMLEDAGREDKNHLRSSEKDTILNVLSESLKNLSVYIKNDFNSMRIHYYAVTEHPHKHPIFVTNIGVTIRDGKDTYNCLYLTNSTNPENTLNSFVGYYNVDTQEYYLYPDAHITHDNILGYVVKIKDVKGAVELNPVNINNDTFCIEVCDLDILVTNNQRKFGSVNRFGSVFGSNKEHNKHAQVFVRRTIL